MADFGIQVEDSSDGSTPAAALKPSTDDDTHEKDESHHPDSSPNDASYRKWFILSLRRFLGIIKVIWQVLVIFSLIIAVFPIFISLSGERWMKKKQSESKIKGIYEKVFLYETLTEKMNQVSMANITRIGVLALLLLLTTLCVPSLKRKIILGSLLWKWSLLAVVIFHGYCCARTAYISPLAPQAPFFEPEEVEDKSYYWYGLYKNGSLLLHLAAILIIWLVYFHTGNGLSVNSGDVDKYVTCTLVSSVVWAILGVLKDVVVLHWKAKAIYRRFKPRILMAGFQLYFLCIILNEFARHSLMPLGHSLETFDFSEPNKRRSIQDYFLSRRVSLESLSDVADRVASLAEVLREDDGVTQVEKLCREKISTNRNELHITTEYLVGLFQRLYKYGPMQSKKIALGDGVEDDVMKEDAHLLLEELRAHQASDEVTHEMLREWMVDAHKGCLSLGYTLVDALAVVNVLDWVLTWFIVVVVVLLWLLVTGLATTKVLVTIASPFLALTFIFGDKFKAFFQVAIFSFATHPFDVGDECRIDNVELVVKNINILTTTLWRLRHCADSEL